MLECSRGPSTYAEECVNEQNPHTRTGFTASACPVIKASHRLPVVPAGLPLHVVHFMRPHLLLFARGPFLPDGRAAGVVNGQREQAEEQAHAGGFLVELQLVGGGQPAQEVPAARGRAKRRHSTAVKMADHL